MPRTNHTYVCPFCRGTFQKDWLYKSEDDDCGAMCAPCFDKRAEITEVVPDPLGRDFSFGLLHNKITGEDEWIPVRVVKRQ